VTDPLASAVRRSVPASRRDAEARFDRLIRRNRFTISVFFPSVGALSLLASAAGWLPPTLSFNPLLLLVGVFVMRSPLVACVTPLVDRRAAHSLLALVAYTYAVEYVGVSTGVPYGEFAYGVELGPTAGGVPLALPLFFVPLVVDAYLLCLLLLGDRAGRTAVRVGVTAATVVAMDLVLDPGAVALGFWSYAGGGPFYGVPLSNFLGWALSAVVATILVDRAFDRRALLGRLSRTEFALDDLVSFVLLWGVVDVRFGNWAAAAVAALFAVALLRTDRFDAGLLWPRRGRLSRGADD
jgi:putative membrane protein